MYRRLFPCVVQIELVPITPARVCFLFASCRVVVRMRQTRTPASGLSKGQLRGDTATVSDAMPRGIVESRGNGKLSSISYVAGPAV